MVRTPAVAGQFYPGRPQELLSMLEEFLSPRPEPKPALAVVCPHAGYVYSGRVVGKVLSRVAVPQRVVLLGPNHRGVGAAAAVMIRGQWSTPLGLVDLDEELGQSLLAASRLVEEDSLAHRFEHSLEVQVPFLQVLQPELKLLPVCLGGLAYPECESLGKALAKVVREAGEPVLLMASTDMSHYEPAAVAQGKDGLAIARVEALDPRGLYDVVRGQGITMCGVLPTTVVLTACRELGATRAELVQYTNSGEVSGDYNQVVGYAGMIID